MQLSETVKLYPGRSQKAMIVQTMAEYVDTVNHLVSDAAGGRSISKITTADVSAALPSALKNQCIRDARSIIRKHYRACRMAVGRNRKLLKSRTLIPHRDGTGSLYYTDRMGRRVRVTAPHLPVVKKPCCYVNNQNFRIRNGCIEFPVLAGGRSTRISVPARMTGRQAALFSGAVFGTMRIVIKNRALVAQIVYESKEPELRTGGSIMGVDLGIKCPAVSYCSDGSIRFHGNGRRNKYLRRHYAYLRRKLQAAGKQKAVTRIGHKEQRIMRDLDHKLSREIVNTAVSRQVRVIRLEQLQNIRSATRKSRKNNHSLHTWSFYRLTRFIEYKARLAGISVEYVSPAYTSQTCPVCGSVHHAEDRNYTCSCGFHTHRDILGAMNICNSTESVGNRRTA